VTCLTDDFLETGSDILLQRCAAGDRGAFRALYDRHAPRLYAVALRITRHAGAASDVVQEAFIQTWRNAGRFDTGRGNAEAWMTGLVRYRALDLLRRAGPRTVDLDEVSLAEAGDTVTALDGETEGRALRQCLERLEPERRHLVILAFVEGFSHSELAVRLATPLGTVKSSIRRALAALRECLGP
jgi:RNA polymerase sigma-70 factor (ECF subfamily)